MKIKITILSVLSMMFFLNSFGQSIDFKLIEAIKTNEILIDRTLKSESLNEADILPENKNYLIITAEVNYKGKQPLRLKKNDVTIGGGENNAIGYLTLSKRGDLQWGYKGDLWDGKNYFTAIFIIDSNLAKTTINIKSQAFEIPKIIQSTLSFECFPKATITKKEYLDKITFQDSYRKANNQPFTKKITPKNGKLLSLSFTVEFCENVDYFRRSSFRFEPTFFQIQSPDGTLFNCVGTVGFGKFNKPFTYNILNKDDLKQDVTLIYNVKKEEKYVLKYLGEKIADF